MKEPRKLDKKDVEILAALDRTGGNVSAERLAEILDYPARTIRYRLSKLKETGYLTTLLAMSHEFQFGLGDSVLLLDTTDAKHDLTLSHLDSFPVFYYLSPTYGRLNGYLIHASYIRDELEEFNRIIESLYDSKLITSHVFFDDADFVIFKANMSQFSRDDRWRWDWKKWRTKSKRILKRGNSSTIKFNHDQSLKSFDVKDVEIIQLLRDDATRTLKELGSKLRLSDTQIGKRIKRLERIGVIKGYRWLMGPDVDSIYIYTFFELQEPKHPALTCFQQLPFASVLMMETPTKFCLRSKMDSGDILGYMRGLDTLRPHLKSCYIQSAHDFSVVESSRVWNAIFDFETGNWRMDPKPYILDLKKKIRKQKK